MVEGESMADFQDLIYEVEDFVCTITLNRPGKRNALSAQLVNELIYALELAGEDDAVRAVILTRAVRPSARGGDLSQMVEPAVAGSRRFLIGVVRGIEPGLSEHQ